MLVFGTKTSVQVEKLKIEETITTCIIEFIRAHNLAVNDFALAKSNPCGNLIHCKKDGFGLKPSQRRYFPQITQIVAEILNHRFLGLVGLKE